MKRYNNEDTAGTEFSKPRDPILFSEPGDLQAQLPPRLRVIHALVQLHFTPPPH